MGHKVIVYQREDWLLRHLRGGGSKGFKMLAPTLFLLLDLSPFAWAALPSFLSNLGWDSSYRKCDQAMCWSTTFDIEVVADFRVPNSSLVIANYDWNWWEVTTSSLLEECSPSLPLSQVAYSFSACKDIDDSSIEEACIAVQRDWLDENGEIRKSLLQMYSEMPKAESFINECLALDGDHVNELEELFYYYDYSDYYDYDYYDEILWDEKSGKRQKRSLEEKLEERVKQRKEGRRGRARKGGRNGKVRGMVKKQRNGENSGQRGRNLKQRGAKRGKKSKKSKKNEKKKSTKGRKKTKAAKQIASKKKKEKQALRKIGLKKVPSQLVLAQLKCIWLAVDLALEDCGKNVLKNSIISNF